MHKTAASISLQLLERSAKETHTGFEFSHIGEDANDAYTSGFLKAVHITLFYVQAFTHKHIIPSFLLFFGTSDSSYNSHRGEERKTKTLSHCIDNS